MEDRSADVVLAAHPRLSPVLTAEMSRLYSMGYSLIPLGGSDGKRPTVNFKDRKRLPLSMMIDRMANGGSRAYGIRLDGILVVDVDTDTDEARAYVQEHFGASSARTKTGRGFHLYFRFAGKKPPSVRLPNVSIDFKSGPNEFVVGPQSERPDGVIYWPVGRIPAIHDLPKFKDVRSPVSGTASVVPAVKVPVGSRNDALKRRAGELLSCIHSEVELFAALVVYRDTELEGPSTIPDQQIHELATWYWDLRASGRWWGGENATINIKRSTVETLAADGHHRALSLLLVLTGIHGRQPGHTFAIDPRAMRRSGHFKDGLNQLYAAIELLVEKEWLERVERAGGRRVRHRYRLGAGRKEDEGRGAYSYIGLRNGDPRSDDAEAA